MANSDHDEEQIDDEFVKQFMEQRWRDAVENAHCCMEALRSIHPDLTAGVPEHRALHVENALAKATSLYAELIQFGRYVLDDRFNQFLEAQTEKRLEQ